jgi:hypothetical protein
MTDHTHPLNQSAVRHPHGAAEFPDYGMFVAELVSLERDHDDRALTA